MAKIIWNTVMSVLYMGMGMVFFFMGCNMDKFPLWLNRLFGLLFLVYGIYRVYRVILLIRINKQDNETV